MGADGTFRCLEIALNKESDVFFLSHEVLTELLEFFQCIRTTLTVEAGSCTATAMLLSTLNFNNQPNRRFLNIIRSISDWFFFYYSDPLNQS